MWKALRQFVATAVAWLGCFGLDATWANEKQSDAREQEKRVLHYVDELERNNIFSPENKYLKGLISNRKFSAVSPLSKLPAAVKNYYFQNAGSWAIAKGDKCLPQLFATGNQAWKSGCLRYENDSRAEHFLQFCVSSEQIYVLYYWTGGYGITRSADIFILKDQNTIQNMIFAQPLLSSSEIHSFAQFQNALAKNQLLVRSENGPIRIPESVFTSKNFKVKPANTKIQGGQDFRREHKIP